MSAISKDSLVNASVSNNREHSASSITRNLRCCQIDLVKHLSHHLVSLLRN